MTDEQRIQAAPIRKTLRLRATRERSFEIFAQKMGSWWNRGHSVLSAMGQTEQADLTIEPFVGGRWYETGADGTEYQWGRVLAWDPPSRLVLAWQLTAEWQYDPDFETTIDVHFIEQGEFTEVIFEHRDLDRYGEAAAQQREGMDGGWGDLLAGFERAIHDQA